MGHDISGYKPSDKDFKNEVAHLRRGLMDGANTMIYKALNAHEHFTVSSGRGNWEGYDKDTLKSALKYVSKDKELQPERDFLNACLSNMENDKIVIYFG